MPVPHTAKRPRSTLAHDCVSTGRDSTLDVTSVTEDASNLSGGEGEERERKRRGGREVQIIARGTGSQE
eukprot:3863640-Rhodomonas_salina.2